MKYKNYVNNVNKRSNARKIMGLVNRFINYILLRKRYMKFIKVGAVISESVYIDKKANIYEPQNLIIEEGTVITKAKLDCRGGLYIGKNCIINDDVKIITATHDYNSKTYDLIKRKSIIGDYAWIASNSMILPGVRIGKGAIVGAGAVVSKDIPDYSIVVGNPARIIGDRKKVHDDIPICSYVGADYLYYLRAIRGEYDEK